MFGPRWNKVLADIWSNRLRTLLVVLSIAAGVFAVGLISGGFVILLRDLDADYQAALPHSATILSEPFDEDALKAAERVPGVARAEGRSMLMARVVQPDGEPLPVRIVAVPDLAAMEIDRLRFPTAPAPVDGTPGTAFALKEKELLFERSGLNKLAVAPGDQIQVELPGGNQAGMRTLRVGEIVHDVTIHPTTMSGELNVYVDRDTMTWLGGPADFDRLLIRVADRPRDEAHVREVAQAVSHKLERGDRRVLATLVARPGEHPNAFVIQALLILLAGLGGLSVFLSGFLVATTINALLGQQVRQIGLMKAVGAGTGQIAGMYIVLVLSFGVMALLLAAAPAAAAAYTLVSLVADFLNFNIGKFQVPYEALALQTLVALAVPLVAALPGVLKGARLTVREAINVTYRPAAPHKAAPAGAQHAARPGAQPAGARWAFRAPSTDAAGDHALISVTTAGFALGREPQAQGGRTILSRPLLLTLRNSLRRRGRLALTLMTLTLAGAIFIAVFNVRASFAGTISDTLDYFLANVAISLNRTYRTEQIEQIVAAVPGVAHVESWGILPGQVLAADEKTGTDVVFLAPPAGSELVKPVLTAGRWLQAGDQDAIVIGNQITGKRPELKVGDALTTRILGKKYTWHVVGIFKMAGNMSRPLVYTDYTYLTHTLNQTGRAGAFYVVTDAQDGASEARVAQALDNELRLQGVQVSDISTGTAQRAESGAGINILIYFLIGMAILIALVGGLGLMGTMSMNVMERTHEIGVMRAIGVSDGHIMQLVILEGLLIGGVSWLLGAALAVPVSKFFSDVLGQAVVSTPLRLTFTPEGFGLWLATILGLSALASLVPAYRASRLTVREVLAYE